MYNWEDSSRNVTTGVVGLTITADNKQRTNIAQFDDLLIISVPSKYRECSIMREITIKLLNVFLITVHSNINNVSCRRSSLVEKA